jgi:hypothetical protein
VFPKDVVSTTSSEVLKVTELTKDEISVLAKVTDALVSTILAIMQPP